MLFVHLHTIRTVKNVICYVTYNAADQFQKVFKDDHWEQSVLYSILKHNHVILYHLIKWLMYINF